VRVRKRKDTKGGLIIAFAHARESAHPKVQEKTGDQECLTALDGGCSLRLGFVLWCLVHDQVFSEALCLFMNITYLTLPYLSKLKTSNSRTFANTGTQQRRVVKIACPRDFDPRCSSGVAGIRDPGTLMRRLSVSLP
jgi:hypothetical protein